MEELQEVTKAGRQRHRREAFSLAVAAVRARSEGGEVRCFVPPTLTADSTCAGHLPHAGGNFHRPRIVAHLDKQRFYLEPLLGQRF